MGGKGTVVKTDASRAGQVEKQEARFLGRLRGVTHLLFFHPLPHFSPSDVPLSLGSRIGPFFLLMPAPRC